MRKVDRVGAFLSGFPVDSQSKCLVSLTQDSCFHLRWIEFAWKRVEKAKYRLPGNLPGNVHTKGYEESM